MREIKFRAWSNVHKEWLYDSRIDLYGNIYFDVGDYDTDGYGSGWRKHHNGNISLMQYTGLKDKNGKEIYEGDILKTDSGNKQVIYNAPSFDLEDYDNGDYYEGQNPYCHNWNEFEIIGNIYENPELLKVKS